MFKNKKYKLIKKAFSKDVMNLCENYILLKNKCYDTLSDKTYLSPYNADWGFYEKHSPRGQVPETYDCLLYKGEQVEHWREPLRGENCVQIFLHYVRDKKQEYDRRINLGLPKYEFLKRKD